ncbi:MAG: Fe-Mn family superoxide dismutase [Candidatus Taylorbacteria bacterium]
MKQFTTKTFNIPVLKGISAKTNEEHLKLYAAYVKNTNLLLETSDRRFGFEYDGMRNHELYFSAFEGGAKTLGVSPLSKAIDLEYGSFESFMTAFKNLALTRGVGWAMLWYDRKDQRLISSWIDEQHMGQLSDCAPLLALDMWEHSYVADYQPSGKKQYIEDFFANINWEVISKNFDAAAR